MQPLRHLLLTLMVVAATWSPAAAQEIYVPNYSENSVSVLNANTLEEIATIPIQDSFYPDSFPDSVVLSRDRKFAFVSIDESDEIAVINTAKKVVVKYIQAVFGSLETQIFLNPRGDRLYVNNCAFPTIAVIDVRKLAMIDVIDLPDGGGSYEMEFSPDGRIGYAGNFSDEPQPDGCGSPKGIYRLDLQNNAVLDLISTDPFNVVGLAVSPLGGVALATTHSDTILAVNLETGDFTEVSCAPDCVDTAMIVFDADGDRAYAVDVATNTLISLNTTDPMNPVVLAPTPIEGDGSAWELLVSGDRLFVVLQGEPSSVVSFDISEDPPFQVASTGFAGAGGFELAGWWRPVGGDSGTRGSKDKPHTDNGKHKGHDKKPRPGKGHAYGHQLGKNGHD